MSVHLGTSIDTATHAVSFEELLHRLLSDHPPTIFVADASEQLNRAIAVSSLGFGQNFRFGDDDDGVVYQLLCEKKTLFFSQLLPRERFRRKTTWYQMVDTKYHFVELAGNSPTGRPGTDRKFPLDLSETVTRLRMRLEKQPA